MLHRCLVLCQKLLGGPGAHPKQEQNVWGRLDPEEVGREAQTEAVLPELCSEERPTYIQACHGCESICSPMFLLLR